MMQQPPPQGQPIPQQPAGPPPVTIDAVMKLLRDERMRGFKIDIETDSLVEADQQQEKQSANELVTSLAGFFKEFGPIVQAMPPLAPMASQLLCFALRRYKVGAELEEIVEKSMEDVVQRLENPQPPQPDPTEQAKLEIAKTKGQAEVTKANLAVQSEQSKANADKEKAQLDAELAKFKTETEVQLAREKQELEKEAMLLDAELKRRADERAQELHLLQIANAREAHTQKLQQSDQQHSHSLQKGEQDMQAKAESHKQGIEQTKASGEAKEKAAKADKPEPKSEPKAEANPVKDVVAILETLGKSQKAKKVIRDKDGKITGIE